MKAENRQFEAAEQQRISQRQARLANRANQMPGTGVAIGGNSNQQASLSQGRRTSGYANEMREQERLAQLNGQQDPVQLAIQMNNLDNAQVARPEVSPSNRLPSLNSINTQNIPVQPNGDRTPRAVRI